MPLIIEAHPVKKGRVSTDNHHTTDALFFISPPETVTPARQGHALQGPSHQATVILPDLPFIISNEKKTLVLSVTLGN